MGELKGILIDTQLGGEHRAACTSVPADLKLLALIDHFALGGAELMLSQFAAAAPRSGIRVEIACLTELDGNPAAAALRDAGIEPVNLGIPPRLGSRALRLVRDHIARVRPDVVHTHLGSSDTLGCTAARTLGTAAVSSIHAMDWDGSVRARAKLQLAAAARRWGAARIIAVSDSAREVYLARRWARPDQVVTIHNGVDVSPEPGAGEAVRRELGIARDALVLGMISALRPEKGHDLAIEAVESLRRRFPQLRLLIVGQGAAGEEIARLAAPLGGSVVLAGRRSDVMRVFDAVDVCLQPSRADAFPTTLLEAMAASVPVIATAVGGIPEMLDDQTGILLPAPPTTEALAEAASHLLNDPARRRQLAAAARRRYEARFTADPWIRRTRELYDAILDARSSRHG